MCAGTVTHSLRGLGKLVNLMELYCGNNDIVPASEVRFSAHPTLEAAQRHDVAE